MRKAMVNTLPFSLFLPPLSLFFRPCLGKRLSRRGCWMLVISYWINMDISQANGIERKREGARGEGNAASTHALQEIRWTIDFGRDAAFETVDPTLLHYFEI